MVRITGIGLALSLAVTSLANAAEEDPLEDALVSHAAAFADFGHTLGACERYVNKADADELVATITGGNRDSAQGAGSDLTKLMAHYYGKGRGEAATLNWSHAECTKLLEDGQAAIKRTGNEFRRQKALRGAR